MGVAVCLCPRLGTVVFGGAGAIGLALGIAGLPAEHALGAFALCAVFRFLVLADACGFLFLRSGGLLFLGYLAGADIFARVLFNPTRDKVLSEKLTEDYDHMKTGNRIGVGFAWNDFWHTVPDWNNILSLGFAGILAQTLEYKQKAIESGNCTQDMLHFYDSIIICYQAIIKYYKRVYAMSLSYDIPAYSESILSLTVNPPQNLYQAMLMSIMFLYMEEIGPERARSLGPIDRLYYPFYQKDLESGVSPEDITEMFRFFFLHFTATKRFAQQPFTIGGADENGNTYANELTWLILNTYDELNIFDPKIHFRYHKGMDDALMLKVLDMIRRGNSSICILNDEVIIKGYEKLGVPRKDAAKYVVLGCYEPIIMGKEEAEIGASWLNMAKPLEFAFNSGKDILTGIQYGPETPADFADFDAFYEAFLQQLTSIVNFSMKNIVDQGKLSNLINPSPLYSSTFTQCLAAGKDVHDYPLEYNNISIKCFALATVVDSLMMVKKYVFDLKEITFAQMKDAILNNWEGYEDLRTKLLKDPEKYGNNLPAPDELMVKIVNHLISLVKAMELDRQGHVRLGMDSITKNVLFGKNTAATPDGRHHCDMVSKNLCPVNGMDHKGLTAYMNSMLKLDHTELLDSGILDFMVHPSAIQGKKGLNDFYSLVKSYFHRGGFALQGNMIDTDVLKDAQLHPENYPTLQVRVCGWNEYFVNMSREHQDIFINGR